MSRQIPDGSSKQMLSMNGLINMSRAMARNIMATFFPEHSDSVRVLVVDNNPDNPAETYAAYGDDIPLVVVTALKLVELELSKRGAGYVPHEAVDRLLDAIRMEEELAAIRKRPHHNEVMQQQLQKTFQGAAGTSSMPTAPQGDAPKVEGVDDEDLRLLKESNPALYDHLRSVHERVKVFNEDMRRMVQQNKQL